jgi:hypothetical protein
MKRGYHEKGNGIKKAGRTSQHARQQVMITSKILISLKRMGYISKKEPWTKKSRNQAKPGPGKQVMKKQKTTQTIL